MLGGNGGGTGLHFPPLDLTALLQFVVTALLIACGLLVLLKNFASKYFVVDTSFEEGAGIQVYEDSSSLKSSSSMSIGGGTGGGGGEGNSGHEDSTNRCKEKCFVCGKDGKKVCSRCKSVRYCSQDCQSKNWEDHKPNCRKRESDKIALVPARGVYKVLKKPKMILFPYDEFMKLYYWEKKVFPPCGLLNCGNSCFANVVLQCLSCTRPLVGYLLDDNHSRECRRNDWCFLCELQLLIKKVSQSSQPLSAINILSRLPNIGSHLGYGRQEDAHEFMRFAIDTMQSIYLDEFGGEKALDPSSQETSIIQYIFGGLLQSQVICMKCNMVSNRYENMMDMTVEIQGDAESLEHCLDQFTAKESLEGENMYRCDGCNDYVNAVKRLTVHQAPNILTVTLKRFQSGRFGKLNKRVAFPETLDLGPYMSSPGGGDNLYALYAVVVHLDMLNASFFGHYICFTKDFSGHWYMIDDCKVIKVELEEVLSQGAYMLLYSRLHVRQPKPTPQSGNAIEHLQLTPPVSASSDPVKCVDTAGRDRFPIHVACPENKEKCDMDVDEPGTSNFSNLSIQDTVSTDLCEKVMDDDVRGALSSDIACQEVPEEVDIASEESSLGLKEPEEDKHSPRILSSCKLDEDSNFIEPVDTTNCSPVLSTCSVSSMQENYGENATPSICSPKIDHAVSLCVPSSSSENTKTGLTSFHDKGTSSLASGSRVRSMCCEEKPLFSRGFLDKAPKKKLPPQSKQVLSIRNGNKCSLSTGSLAVADGISELELHSDFLDKYEDGEVQGLVRNSKVGHSCTHDNNSSNCSVSGAAEKTFGDHDPCQQAGYMNCKNNGRLTKFHGNSQGGIDVPANDAEEIGGCPSEDWSRSMGKSLTRETKNDGQRYDFFQNAVGEDGLTFCQLPKSNGFLDKLSQESQDNNGIHVFKEVNCSNTTRNDMPKKFNLENCEAADENSLKSDACEKVFSCSTGSSSGAPLLNESHHSNKTYINGDYAEKKSKPSIDISSQRIAEPTEQGSASFRVMHYGNGIGEPSSVRT